MEESQKILKLAISIGETLLESGGEIYRVQETIGRILIAYGIEDYHVFVVSNGIFATIHEDRRDRGSMVRYVPLGAVHLGRIVQLNQLSREICDQGYPLDVAFEKLEQCKNAYCISGMKKLLATGMGCASFCYIFGGKLPECVLAFILGMLLQLFMSAAKQKEVSKFIINIIGSAMVMGISLLLVQLGLDIMQDKVVIGSIIMLVPGVALTTSIRELFSGDYLSGGIHLMDALLTAFSIAVGVGATILVFQMMGGAGL